jgi:hypothetical protein
MDKPPQLTPDGHCSDPGFDHGFDLWLIFGTRTQRVMLTPQDRDALVCI